MKKDKEDIYFLCSKDMKPILWENIRKNRKNREDIVFSNNLHELIRIVKPSYFRKENFLNNQLVAKMDKNGNLVTINDNILLEAVYDISEEMGEDLPPIKFDYSKLMKEIYDLMGKFRYAELIVINDSNIVGFDLLKKNKKVNIVGDSYPYIKISRLCFEATENLAFCYLKINTEQKVNNEDIHEIYAFLIDGLPYKNFFKIEWRFSTAQTVLETMTIDSKPSQTDIYCSIDGTKICGFDLI